MRINARLLTLNAELAQAQSRAEQHTAQLEVERAELARQLEEARTLVAGRLIELEQENALLIQTRTQLEGESSRLRYEGSRTRAEQRVAD
jgi:hypothetical protein